jgi:hypothetical protein
MADLARLVVRLEAESLKYQKELEKSQKKLSKFERAANRSTGGISKAAKASGAVIAGAATAAVAGLTLIFNKQRDLIDSQAKMAQQLDTTFASIANLKRAGELGGVGLNKIEVASRQLNINLGEAIAGTKAQVDAFDRLGLSAQEIFDLPLDQRIAKINQALRDNVQASERAAVAADIFGSRNAKAIQQLDPGTIAEAARQVELFGLNLSDVDSTKVEMANDAFSTFGLLIDGAQKQLTVQLAPILKAVGDEFLRAAEEAGGLGNVVQDATQTIVNGLSVILNVGAGIGRVFTITKELIVGTVATGLAQLQRLEAKANEILAKLPDFLGGSKFAANAKAVGDAAEANFARAEMAAQRITDALNEPLAGDAFKQFFADAQKAATEAAAATVAGRKAALATGGAGAAGGAGTGSAANKARASAVQSLASMTDSLRMQIDTLGMGETATLKYRIEQGDLAQTLREAGAAGQQYADQLLRLTERQESMRKDSEMLAEELAALTAEIEEGRAVFNATRTPLEQYQLQIAKLNTLSHQGAIDQDTYNRAVMQAQGAFDAASQGANQFGIDLEQIGRTLGENIQGSLAEFLFDPFKNGTDGMLQQFSDLLRKMAAEIAAAEIMKFAFGAGGVGSGGGAIGAGLAALGGFFGGARANGGPVNSGSAFLVGERGPEVFVPGTSGTIMNARDTERMGGRGETNFFISTPDANSFRANKRQTRRAAREIVA